MQDDARTSRPKRWLTALALGLVIAACGARAPVETGGGTAYEAGRFDDYKPHS